MQCYTTVVLFSYIYKSRIQYFLKKTKIKIYHTNEIGAFFLIHILVTKKHFRTIFKMTHNEYISYSVYLAFS